MPDDQSFMIGLFKNSLCKQLAWQPSRIKAFTRSQGTHADKEELYLEKEPPKLPHTTEPASR